MDTKTVVGKSGAQSITKPERTPERPVELVPNPEVVERASRRTLSAEYKLRILEKTDACTPEERGALLRREGLYASHLTNWRRQRENGSIAGLAPRKRGPMRSADQSQSCRIVDLEQLRARLKKAETVIEVQEETSDLLGSLAHQTPKGGGS